MIKRKRWLWLVVAVITIGIACYGLRWVVPWAVNIMQPSYDEWFRALTITQDDLPSGWIPTTLEDDEVIGAESAIYMRYAKSTRKNEPVQAITHYLSLYESNYRAGNAYIVEVASLKGIRQAISLDGTWEADQIYIGCTAEPVIQGATLCNSVGQYGNVISHIHAFVYEDRPLTYEDFIFVVQQVDRRIAGNLGLEP